MKIVKISMIALAAVLSFTACSNNNDDALKQATIIDSFRNENNYNKKIDLFFAILNNNKEKLEIYKNIVSDNFFYDSLTRAKNFKKSLKDALNKKQRYQLQNLLRQKNDFKRWKYFNDEFVPAAKTILEK